VGRVPPLCTVDSVVRARVLRRDVVTMYGSRMLVLLAARPRVLRILAAANSHAAALSSAASTAGYHALDAARQRRGWNINELDASASVAFAPTARAPALVAAASAGGILDGSAASCSALRNEQWSLSRLPRAQLFALHASTPLSSGAAGGRSAEAGLPTPSQSCRTSAVGCTPLLSDWPLHIEARWLWAVPGPEMQQQRPASGSSVDSSAGSGPEAGRPLLPSRGLATRATIMGGRWPSVRAAAPPGLFGTLWSEPSREFSAASGAAAGGHADGGDAASAATGSGVADERPVLVKLGDGLDTDIDIPIKELWSARRGGFVNTLATSSSFRVDFEGVSHSKCRVFLLPKVAGKLPTAEEEACAVELAGTMTFGELAAQVDPSSSAIFARVRFPAVVERVGEDGHIPCSGLLWGALLAFCACFRT